MSAPQERSEGMNTGSELYVPAEPIRLGRDLSDGGAVTTLEVDMIPTPKLAGGGRQ